MNENVTLCILGMVWLCIVSTHISYIYIEYSYIPDTSIMRTCVHITSFVATCKLNLAETTMAKMKDEMCEDLFRYVRTYRVYILYI